MRLYSFQFLFLAPYLTFLSMQKRRCQFIYSLQYFCLIDKALRYSSECSVRNQLFIALAQAPELSIYKCVSRLKLTYIILVAALQQVTFVGGLKLTLPIDTCTQNCS